MLPLPTELWFEIGTQECITQRDLHSLVLTSRLFLDLFTPLLYATVHVIPDPNPRQLEHDTSEYWMMKSRSRLLLERLRISQQLRSYVRTFRLKYVNDKLEK
jgi:hypothetical protein